MSRRAAPNAKSTAAHSAEVFSMNAALGRPEQANVPQGLLS